MDILVVGGGGREAAIVHAMAKSPRVGRLHCAPGNAGIAALAQCHAVKADDVEGMVKLAKELKVDRVFVAPDDPLGKGMVDAMEREGIAAFGPYAAAARIEGSKVYSKWLMKKYGIPTADYQSFSDPQSALSFIYELDRYPIVLKADGLALGKGVIIARDYDEASAAVRQIMTDKAFGDAGSEIVIEEFLEGREVTVLAFCDGKTLVAMPPSQDHKKALDGDKGLNTGGMGVFAPSRYYTPDIARECEECIFKPTMRALQSEGIVYKGVIYFGLMMTARGVYVIEYNARFGDPEAQGVLPLLKTDLVDIMDAVIFGKLDSQPIEWSDCHTLGVVMASGGYPEGYTTGYEILGLDNVTDPDVTVYHAGTRLEGGKVVTAGGRVLCVTAMADTSELARAKAYEAVEKISFRDAHFRRDIGAV